MALDGVSATLFCEFPHITRTAVEHSSLLNEALAKEDVKDFNAGGQIYPGGRAEFEIAYLRALGEKYIQIMG